MSNSIDLNHNSENNTIFPLTFIWVALFNDGKIIRQFDADGSEHLFNEVKNNFDKLIRFSLVNKDSSKIFSIDLKKALIIYNNCNIDVKSNEKKNNIRLIFFRRHRVELSSNFKEQNHHIEYHLGYQWASIDNQNRQVILIIDQEGNFITEG